MTAANPFNVSARKVGGLTFLKVGRLTVSYCIAKTFRPVKGTRQPRYALTVQRALIPPPPPAGYLPAHGVEVASTAECTGVAFMLATGRAMLAAGAILILGAGDSKAGDPVTVTPAYMQGVCDGLRTIERAKPERRLSVIGVRQQGESAYWSCAPLTVHSGSDPVPMGVTVFVHLDADHVGKAW